MKTLNPNLPKIKLTYKGRSIEIPYHCPRCQGIQYVDILDGKGNEHRFYKGMYSPGEWIAKDTEHWDIEFKELLIQELEKLEPKYDAMNTGKKSWEEKRWWETP